MTQPTPSPETLVGVSEGGVDALVARLADRVAKWEATGQYARVTVPLPELQAVFAALRARPAQGDDALERAWRDGWAECKASLTDDETFCLTEDVEQDAWLDSDTRKYGSDARSSATDRLAARGRFPSGGDVPFDVARDLIAAAIRDDAPRGRAEAAPVDDEINRAFIAGWNATIDHSDFDMALHHFMLAGVTHVGGAPIGDDAPQAGEREERLENGLERIVQWADAYPINIFREPDFEVCAAALKEVGQTLDAVSASNMRHVIKGVGEIARSALGTDGRTSA